MSDIIAAPLPRAPAARAGMRSARFPAWLRRRIPAGGEKGRVEEALARGGLSTVCVEARCPNRAECFCRGTAAFLIMGDTCTRSCRFCAVSSGTPRALDISEPQRLVDAVQRLGLGHVVITSVTRDDLPDGGAGHFAKTVSLLKSVLPAVTVEVLVPDFGGNTGSIRDVLHSGPHVFNHNVETVPRLYPSVRPQADYRRSLSVLSQAAENNVVVKSGLMVGLGERGEEVLSVMEDLREAGCSVVTIGQYLRPRERSVPVAEFVAPERFEEYRTAGVAMGLREVVAGPFVRSSYRADEIAETLLSPRSRGDE